MSPSVDVILPNYNKAKFLDEAIKSVIAQNYKNWNLYIIDDCSSDNSVKIINNYSNLHNVNIIKLNKNKGPAFCRNYQNLAECCSLLLWVGCSGSGRRHR